MPEQLNKESIIKPSTPYDNLITEGEVKDLLKRILGDKAEFQNYVLQSYSDGKIGFLGSHQRLLIEALINKQLKILRFFVKIIPYDVPTQADYVIKKGVFQQEIAFYREVVPELCKDYNGEPWAAKCYLVKEDLLVFEDLGRKGYTMRDKLFNKDLVIAGLSALARLHASSILAEVRLKKSLKKIYPYAFNEKAFTRNDECHKWFLAGVKLAEAIAKNLGLKSTFLATACDTVFDAVQESPTKRNVASHGDLWGNNLLFNENASPKCLLVDFQLSRYTPLAHDVAQFLYLCTNRSFREIWEKSMLQHYYKVLCATLKSSKISVEVPPFSEVLQGMEEQRLAALITAVIYFPTVLLDEELGAKIMNDPDTYTEFVFHDRTDAVMKNMKKDRVYRERLEEAVTELVELSLKLDTLPKPS